MGVFVILLHSYSLSNIFRYRSHTTRTSAHLVRSHGRACHTGICPLSSVLQMPGSKHTDAMSLINYFSASYFLFVICCLVASEGSLAFLLAYACTSATNGRALSSLQPFRTHGLSSIFLQRIPWVLCLMWNPLRTTTRVIRTKTVARVLWPFQLQHPARRALSPPPSHTIVTATEGRSCHRCRR